MFWGKRSVQPVVPPRTRSHLPAIHKQAYWFKSERLLPWEIGDVVGVEHRLHPGIACRVELCCLSQVLPLGVIVLVGLDVDIFPIK